MRAVILAVASAAPVLVPLAARAETLTCSVWQGVRTCQGPGGYGSTEWERGGMTFGQDNQGRPY